MEQHRWLPKTYIMLSQKKKNKLVSEHTAWFHLYKILQQSKLQGAQSSDWGRKGMRRDTGNFVEW